MQNETHLGAIRGEQKQYLLGDDIEQQKKKHEHQEGGRGARGRRIGGEWRIMREVEMEGGRDGK